MLCLYCYDIQYVFYVVCAVFGTQRVHCCVGCRLCVLVAARVGCCETSPWSVAIGDNYTDSNVILSQA